MNPLLLRLLPHIAVVAALLGAIWYFDHKGYERAQADQKALEQRLYDRMAADQGKIAESLTNTISGLDLQQRTVVQPIITKEIARDPRYSSDACALTDSVFEQIGRARAASGAAGSTGAAVPGRPADR